MVRTASRAVLAIACALLAPSVAHAILITIDFEDFPDGPYSFHTSLGVTFSASGGTGAIVTQTAPNRTRGILDTNSPRLELRANITGGTDYVAVELGDFGGSSSGGGPENDLIFIEAYDASGNLVASATGTAFGTGMFPLSVSAPGIAYATFGARRPALNGSSVTADNFTFRLIPEPSVATLLLAGLASLALRRRPGTRP